MEVTLLHVEGCPNRHTVEASLRDLARELGFELVVREVTTADEAAASGMRGSPTVLVDGVDPFGSGDEPAALACRLYATDEGPRGGPPPELLRRVVLDRLGGGHPTQAATGGS